MMKKKQDKSSNDVRSAAAVPTLYNIQYPNYDTNIYSLRAPHTNYTLNCNQQESNTFSSIHDVPHPEYLHVDQTKRQEPSFIDKSFQRDIGVQCSLLSSDSYNRIITPQQSAFLTDLQDGDYLSRRYRVQLKLQPVQPNIYEVWNVETPPQRSIPINESIKHHEPSIRIRSPRLVNIKSLSDSDSDYEDHIVCTHCQSRTYLPTNVRMACVRQDAHTISY